MLAANSGPSPSLSRKAVEGDKKHSFIGMIPLPVSDALLTFHGGEG